MVFSPRSQAKASTDSTQQRLKSKMSATDSSDREPRASATNITYWSIFQFATAQDLMGLIISSAFAIAGGAILPGLTILFGNLASSFRDVSTGDLSVSSAKHDINQFSLYLLYLAIAELVAIFIGTAGFSIVGEHITLQIREKYLEAILRQDIAFFDTIQPGEIAASVSKDVNLIQDGISEKAALILSGLAAFVASLVISFVKSWKLSFIVLSSVVAFLLAIAVGGKLMIGSKTKALESQSKAAGITEEAVASIRVTAAFGAQEFLQQRYVAVLNEAQKWGLQVRLASGLLVGLSTCVVYTEHALSFWQGSRFLVNLEISLSAVITIQIALMMGGAYLAQLLPQLQALPLAVAAAKKVFSTIERRSDIDSLSDEGIHIDEVDGEITFNNVTFNYPTRKEHVFTDLSLVIAAKKVTALVGPSGSGKSTVISLLERFYDTSSGRITLDGHDISSLNIHWLRQQISLVCQEPILFSGSIFDNIESGLRDETNSADKNERMERVINAAKIASAHDFITRMPAGYETNVGDRGVLLSGGQKQRIAIARAIISNPKILLLDEATSALDSEPERLVQQAIEAASKGRTTIVIAHRLSTIRQADNIVVLTDGNIAEQGTYSELMDQNGMFQWLIQAQELNVHSENLSDDVDIANTVSSVLGTNDTEKDQDSSEIQHDIEEVASLKEKIPSKLKSSGSLLHFMWSLNKSEKWIILLGVLFSILSGANQPVRGILFGHSIMALSLPMNQDQKIRHDSNFWSGMFLMLALVQLIALSGQGLFFGISSENLVHRAQELVFRSILRQDIAFFDRLENSPGKLSSLLSNDANSIARLSGATLGAGIVFATTVFGSIGVALGYGWKLSLVCMSIMPLLIVCGFLRFWVLQRLDKRVQRKTQAAGFAAEATNGIRTVASLTMEGTVIKRYRTLLVSEAFGAIWFILKSSAAYASSQAIIFGGCALGFWYGGNLIADGEYTILAFFICFTETLFGAQAAGNIVSFAPEIGTGTGATRSFQSLIESKPDMDIWSSSGDDVDSIEGTIEFRNVCFQYPQRNLQPALVDLSFMARKGKLTAIVGASGSGKSTALALIEQFYQPSSGSVLLDGRQISEFNLRKYRSQIALVNQDTTLYTGTIRDNLCLESNGQVSQNDLDNACRTANIYDFIISLPDGFNTLIGTKGQSLSGGQRQRVAIARALVRNPKILLLDEATSALDTASERVVEEALKAAAQGRTTIAIAHRLSSICHADVIYVLEGGRVAETGTHTELINRRGIYWNMARLQNLEA